VVEENKQINNLPANGKIKKIERTCNNRVLLHRRTVAHLFKKIARAKHLSETLQSFKKIFVSKTIIPHQLPAVIIASQFCTPFVGRQGISQVRFTRTI